MSILTTPGIRVRTRLGGAAVTILVGAMSLVGACSTPLPESNSESGRSPVVLVFPPPPEQARFVFERTITGSADIVEVDRDTRWRQLLTGEAGTTEAMAKPFDVEACQGRIYISDTVRRSVLVFDVPHGAFSEIGKSEPGQLLKPLGMAVDDDCNLYVVDGTQRRVVVYDQAGRYVTAFGGSDWFDRPSHVEVDADGTRGYVVDTGGVGSDRHMVRVFDVQSGSHLFDIGERGAGPGQFNLARDIAIGPGGRLYVVDGGNFRVQIFGADGQYLGSFGSIGVTRGQFSRPKGIDTDPDGNVYVTDSAFGNFQIFSPAGELLLFVGTRSEKPAPAKYMLPAGIAVDEDGRVYLVDQFFRKVDVFRPAGLGHDQGYLGVQARNR